LPDFDHVDVIALIAERKIAEAMEEGQFDDLPGAGRPLPEDDLDSLPAEARLAWRILRNAGFSGPPAPGGGAPFEPALPPGSEEGRLGRRLTRLQLGLESPPGPSGGRREKTRAGEGLEVSGHQERLSTIMGSPYLAKVLDKIGGPGPGGR
jgi:hypothetical protein